MGLYDEPALELQARSHEGRERAGFREEVGDRFGIFVSRQDVVDHGPEAHQPSAHLLTVQLEGGDQIVCKVGGARQ